MIAYADSSALVKLAIAEPETAALVEALIGYDDVVTSELAVVEVTRAAFRAAGANGALQATEVLGAVNKLCIDWAVLGRAAHLPPAALRSLDAIHVASALELGPSVTVVAYDDRLLAAAISAGLATSTPGW